MKICRFCGNDIGKQIEDNKDDLTEDEVIFFHKSAHLNELFKEMPKEIQDKIADIMDNPLWKED